jgi:hypothetical protein
MRKALSLLIWLLFTLWLLLQLPLFLQLEQQGQMPVDYLAYHRAAEALREGQSPYLSPEHALSIWGFLHQIESEIIHAQETGGDSQAILQELAQRPAQSGPYLYPPTLARLILFLRISPLRFALLLLLSIFAFSWLWVRSTLAHSVWLLLVISSWDVLSSLYGGNAELLLLFATLLAAWLLWHGRALLAAPLLALVILIKPFYALFFAAFALIKWASHRSSSRDFVKKWLLTGALAAGIIALEVYAWGSTLLQETFNYLQHAWAYQWFSLPVAEQTPMSDWNRTPLQALITAQIPASAAQLLAIGLWLLFTGITIWYVREKAVTFPLTFALALVLLYWGRPVTWTLPYLEFVVVVGIWPRLRRAERWIMLGSALALSLSHWIALVRAAQGYALPLFTLQTAEFPWETLLVLPLSWLAVLYALSREDDPI